MPEEYSGPDDEAEIEEQPTYAARIRARLRFRQLSALVAWSMSVALAGVAIAIAMIWVHPEPGQWREFFLNVTGEVGGGLAVAFFLSPVFLAIRSFANEKFGTIAEYAPMAGYERFPYLKFIERLERCDDLVRIMDTSSNILDVTTAEGDEVDERHRCVTALTNVLSGDNEVRVEILLLDPTSDAARQRSADLRGEGIDIAAGVGRNLALLNGVRHRLPEGARMKLLVKLYNATPACAYYRVDDRASIAFYSLRTASEQGAHVDVAMKEKLGKIVNDHFRDIRADPESIDMLDYLYGTLVVGRRKEHVAWIEQDDRLYIALASTRENPVAWTAAPSAGGGIIARLQTYRHEDREYRAMRLLPWAECGALGVLMEEKYGVEFQVVFELAPVAGEVGGEGGSEGGSEAGSEGGVAVLPGQVAAP
ncbi:hypothetical protein GCM10009839_35650 [Catenulispora yoronensis]|uniref:Uncharacterized protein n=1 Tax=Catenulispora yoronensis TaxID=450799 RepID=A0ABN2UAM1_9ACTN